MAKEKQPMLVPESEQSYEVPGNWVWTRLGYIGTVKGGKRLPKGHSLIDKKTQYPYIRVTDFDNNSIAVDNIKYLSEETQKLIKNYIISSDDIFISIAGTIGKVGIIPDYLNGSNLTENAAKIIVTHAVDKHYLMYLLNSDDLQIQISSNTLATTQAKLALFRIESLYIPLPPPPEQRRIVERIENLFAKLDHAKELAQSALDSFETRKAAILHKALNGDLTAKWREDNGVGLESWKNTIIGAVCKIGSGGTPSRTNPTFYEGNIPWVKTGEINWNTITDTEEHITDDAIKNSSAKKFPIGTVLVAMYGQGLTRGRAALLGVEATTNQAVCALIPSEKLTNHYLYYYFECNYWKLREKAVGGNQPNFSGTMISKFPIYLPSLPEQQEIVRILDSLLENEQRARELCDVIEKIELMKKAILARAFRGELGTNDPAEESAAELLG